MTQADRPSPTSPPTPRLRRATAAVAASLLLLGLTLAFTGCDGRDAPPPAAAVDLAPLEARLADIDAKLDALADDQASLRAQLDSLAAQPGVRDTLDARLAELYDALLDPMVETALVSAGLAQPGPPLDPRQQRLIEHLFDTVRRFDGTILADNERHDPRAFALDLAVRLRTHRTLILTADRFIDEFGRTDDRGRTLVAEYPSGARRPLQQVLHQALARYDRR